MKNKMWDNSNLQQEIVWGNIELPGLSDQELYAKNWNIVDANRTKFDDPTAKENYLLGIKKRSQDQDWKQNHDRAMKKLSETSDWKLKNKENTDKKKIYIKTPDGVFAGKGTASLFYKVDPGTIDYWIKKKPGYSRITKEEYDSVTKAP